MYDIKKIMSDGKPWLDLRVYFKESHLRRICSITSPTTVLGRKVKPSVVHQILSYQDFYFDIKKNKLIFDFDFYFPLIEKFIIQEFDKKYKITLNDLNPLCRVKDFKNRVESRLVIEDNQTLKYLLLKAVENNSYSDARKYLLLGARSSSYIEFYAKWLKRDRILRLLKSFR